MGTNEEYLDKLLQSVTNGEKSAAVQEPKYKEDMTDDELLASLIEMYSDELAEFKTEEIIHNDESDVKATETIEETPNETSTETVISQEESSMSLDDLLGSNSLVENEFHDEALERNLAEETETTSEIIPEETYTPTDAEYLSQSDIEALLSSLQDDVPTTPVDMVNEQKLVDDFSSNTDPVLDEIISEPQVIDEKDADIFINDLDGESQSTSGDDLLKEMGIESMSAEQIDALLNEASTVDIAEKPKEEEITEMDLNDLFGGFSVADDFDPEQKDYKDMDDFLSGNDDLAEISKLLNKADNNEIVDDSNLRNLLDMDEDIGGNDLLNELLKSESGISGTGDLKEENKQPEKEKKPKEKKKKAKKEEKPKEKKEGTSLWNKLTSILFEEEEDLDDNKVKLTSCDGHATLIDVSENDAILAEMLSEDKQKGKKDKKSKKRDKKNNAGAEDGEEVIDPKEQAKLEKKKQKEEKKAAKKKEKKEKAEADKAFLKAQPSISTKRAMVAFLFALTIMAVILIIYISVPDAVEKHDARKAFYNKDFYKAYELLQGKELNDSDTILLNKVTCILKMQRKLDSYNNYVKMNKEIEALNALIEAVKLYGEEHTYAGALSIDDKYNAIYDEIKIILNGKYGVSEARAKEILAYESDAEYTISLQNIVEGKSLDTKPADDSKKPMEDILPEEKDFLEGQ